MVIDPALDAYTGDPNNLPAVREFVSALAAEAHVRGLRRRAGCSQRKAARAVKGADADPYDPGQVAGWEPGPTQRAAS